MDEIEFRAQVVEALARITESLDEISAELRRTGDIEALLRNIDANVSDTREAVLASG
ncbi:MAG: hypothetical protein QOH46_1604 [Solirubrobacteraceae bacterium]|jgi:hypothetical protein|nr:hypothetical protein [Solirubrobacteraceae bacterium]